MIRRRTVLLGIAGVLVVLGAAAGILLATKDKDQARTSDTTARNQSANASEEQKTLLAQQDPFVQQHLQGCKDRTVSFTSPPVPVSQLGYIEPMGKMNDGHVTPTDHVYVSPLSQQAADNTYDVVMPADGTVSVISAMPAQYIGDRNQQTAPEDHRLVIQHNCRYVSIFIHVHKLSDALQQALGSKLEPNTSKMVSVELKAGDKLGKIGGNPVDWTLADVKQTLGGFITPSLYNSESWKIHAIDPIAVYSGDMRTQLIAKSLRAVEPYGGKIDYDKKGALIGNWFREKTNGYSGADQSRYWDGHLAVVPDYIDPAGTVFSVGNWNGKAAQLMVKGGADPATVTKASGVVKYELVSVGYKTTGGQGWSGGPLQKGMKASADGAVQGTALLQVQDGETLKVELFPGKTAAQVSGFTDGAMLYVR